MMEHEEDVHEPTLIDLVEQLDSEGVCGFIRTFVDDLRGGYEAVNPERFPWLNDLRPRPLGRRPLFGHGRKCCRG